MRVCFLLLFVFSFGLTSAQSDFQFGLLPSLNFNKKLPNEIRLNFKLESRQALQQGFFESNNPIAYDYLLTDLSFLGAKKIAINKTVAIGYLIRFREGQMVHRSIQQFIVSNDFSGFRLSHRFTTDQTFEQDQAPIFRVRYRVSSQIALNGLKVDPKEFYLKMNNEYLNAFEGNDYDLEIRVGPFIGYTFSQDKKMELGLDYRLNSFLNHVPSHRFWIGVNWYQSF